MTCHCCHRNCDREVSNDTFETPRDQSRMLGVPVHCGKSGNKKWHRFPNMTLIKLAHLSVVAVRICHQTGFLSSSVGRLLLFIFLMDPLWLALAVNVGSERSSHQRNLICQTFDRLKNFAAPSQAASDFLMKLGSRLIIISGYAKTAHQTQPISRNFINPAHAHS